MYLVRVAGLPNGGKTPIDREYVVDWDPNTPFGVLAITTTLDPKKARRFASTVEVLEEWRTISLQFPIRPDGAANRPLTGVNIEVFAEDKYVV